MYFGTVLLSNQDDKRVFILLGWMAVKSIYILRSFINVIIYVCLYLDVALYVYRSNRENKCL